VESLASHKPIGLHGLLRDSFLIIIIIIIIIVVVVGAAVAAIVEVHES
jgi:hypothetical protein